jgi:microcompartment protein CcmL/EutN
VRLIQDFHAPIADSIALIEVDGLVRGARLADDLLKAASTRVLLSQVYSGPRHLVLFDGGVEALKLAFDAALAVGGDRLVDSLFLAHAHPSLIAALGGSFGEPELPDEAILLVENETVAASLRAIDAALKTTPVILSSWRLGRGVAGRGLFALRGEHANLLAAEAAVIDAAGAFLLETQLIPRPDPLGPWAQPFGRDPS